MGPPHAVTVSSRIAREWPGVVLGGVFGMAAGQERLLVVMNVDVGETPSMHAALSVSIAGKFLFSR